MIRAIIVLIEILCFYQILRGINGFKATENFVYIFTNKQWTRWGSILSLFGYVVGISILWHQYADLAEGLHHVGIFLISIIIVTVWRTGIKEILFVLLLSFFLAASPVLLYYWFSFSIIAVSIINLFLVSVLVEFKVVYKIYCFIAKRSIFLYIWCFVAALWPLIALFSGWYCPRNAIFVSIASLLFVSIVIYAVKKYNEVKLTNDLKEQSYSEIKMRLERKSIRMMETDKIDIYELQSFWFSQHFNDALTKELERLGLTVDFIKEGEQIKIHVFKLKAE